MGGSIGGEQRLDAVLPVTRADYARAEILLASLDRQGSAIAAGTSFSTLGSALGPGAAAFVVGGGRYGNVFALSIALFVLTLLCFFYSARHRHGLANEAA